MFSLRTRGWLVMQSGSRARIAGYLYNLAGTTANNTLETVKNALRAS